MRSESSVWSLETETECPMARAAGLDLAALSGAHADSFLLSVANTNGRTQVLIVGKNPVAVRSGVARLVTSLRNGPQRLEAPETSGLHSPFFPIRELVVANRGIVLQDTPYADTLWRNWDDDRIRAYAEQIWLMGFNSIQVGEGRSFRITPESEPRALEVAHKIGVLSEAAHANGLKVSQLIWGQAPFNRKICWNAPETRAVMENEFRWMARTFAAKVDHVVMHMRDPGGCNCGKCDDYQTPQEIAAFVLKEYRKLNPKVTLTLSTWFIKNFWSGAPGVRFLSDTSVQYYVGDPNVPFRDPEAVRLLPGAPKTRFLDGTFCPKEVGIALHKWYNADKAHLILESGRPADIWSWYLSDQETTTDMSLCMRRVNYYFESLPPNASLEIRRISSELCFHGWPQIINAYVSGQKMWTPRRDLEDIEREFCAGMFGDGNAETMMELYQTCELVANPKRGDTCLPSLEKVLGNHDFNVRCQNALSAARDIRLTPSFEPRFTTATPPQKLIDYLLRHLEMIITFSEAKEEILAAVRNGDPQAKLQQLLATVEQKAEPFSSELLYPALLANVKTTTQKR